MIQNIETAFSDPEDTAKKQRVAHVLFDLVGAARPDKGVTFAEMRAKQKLLDWLEEQRAVESLEPDEKQLEAIKKAFEAHVWPDIPQAREEALKLGKLLGVEDTD